MYQQRNMLEWGFKGETDDNEFLISACTCWRNLTKKFFVYLLQCDPSVFFYIIIFPFSVDCNITNLLYFSGFVYFRSFFVSYTIFPFSLIFPICRKCLENLSPGLFQYSNNIADISEGVIRIGGYECRTK